LIVCEGLTDYDGIDVDCLARAWRLVRGAGTGLRFRSHWGVTEMNERLSWMLPSIPLGRLFSTDIRLSWWFAIVPLVTIPKYGFYVAIAFTLLLYVSILLHEFAHVFAARWTGGSAEEIHLMPFGGIAMVRPAGGAFGLGMTAAAGPLVNLIICLISFPGWYAPDTLWGSLNPLRMSPDITLAQDRLWRDLGLLLFTANWMPLLLNLLPVMPLDGGNILRAILSTQTQPELVNRMAVHIGLFVSLIFLAAGVIADVSQIVLVGTFVLMMNVVQLFQDEMGEAADDSGLGYDFSSGYESLEASGPTSIRTKPGMIQQWRERRRIRREQQERLRIVEAEQQLDILLAKVHESGLNSLSPQEQNLLKSCSELLRDRTKTND